MLDAHAGCRVLGTHAGCRVLGTGRGVPASIIAHLTPRRHHGGIRPAPMSTRHSPGPGPAPGGVHRGPPEAYWRSCSPMTVFGWSTTGAEFPVTVSAPRIELDLTVVPPVFFSTPTRAMA